MQLTLIKNPDESNIILYKIARILYAETDMSSLRVVEALASMILNIRLKTGQDFKNIIKDKNIFDSLKPDCERNKKLHVNADNKEFQICLRIAQKTINGNLPDFVSGAVRFHRADFIPDWAMSCGYVTEIDDLLFYL